MRSLTNTNSSPELFVVFADVFDIGIIYEFPGFFINSGGPLVVSRDNLFYVVVTLDQFLKMPYSIMN